MAKVENPTINFLVLWISAMGLLVIAANLTGLYTVTAPMFHVGFLLLLVGVTVFENMPAFKKQEYKVPTLMLGVICLISITYAGWILFAGYITLPSIVLGAVSLVETLQVAAAVLGLYV